MNEHKEERFLKSLNIKERIIETENTVFGVLIKAHNMSLVKDNIYEDINGRKFHLTKYGLEPVELFNMNELLKELESERKKSANQLNELNELYAKIDKLKKN